MCGYTRQATMPEMQRECEKPGCQKVAMINFPVQHADFAAVYNPDKALDTGTIFPELDLPWMGERRSKCQM